MKKELYLLTALLLMTSMPVVAQLTEQWHSQFNGKGDFTDEYNCIAKDDNDNIYIGGSTVNTDVNRDYLLIKKDISGNTVWKKVYNGPGNGPDEIKAIVVKNQKVYVTGYGNNVSVGNDYWTMCFSTDGDSLWSNLYNDPTFNQYDEANDLFVDNNGNVYVTGDSDRDITGVTNYDYLTIKLSTTGSLLWATRYNGTGNGTDRAAGIVADASGNAYITGRSANPNDDDYVTIKYNSSGVQQWLQIVDNGGIDRATDIGIDAADNIYVTGRRDNGNDDDYYTVKYNSGGTEVFNKIFDFVQDDRAEAIAVNSDGSFAVTGRSDGNATPVLNYNYFTVMYGTTGTQIWSASFEGTGGNDDVPMDILITPDGRVAVCGDSDSDPSMNVSKNGVMVFYNSAGQMISSYNYNGNAGKNDTYNAVLILSTGQICVAGSTENISFQKDAILSIQQSADMYNNILENGAGDNSDNIRGLIVDTNNNVYVTGYSVGKDADRDMCLVKLNTSGDTLWSRTISGSMFGSDDDANSIAFDNTGNIVIAGYIKNSATGSDVAIAKYNANGAQLWLTLFDGFVHESDRALDMKTDDSGNIYITGKTDINATIVANDEVFTAKYNANGVLLWSATYTGGITGAERGKLIEVAPSGNVYVCGRKFNGTSEDILLIKYNGSGAQQWAVSFDGDGQGNDDPTDMVIDANENIYITGSQESQLNTLYTDYLTLKYNSAGVLQWQKAFGNPIGIDAAEAVAINSAGEVFVTGTVKNAGLDIVTLKYDNNGNEIWNNVFNGSTSLDDFGDDISLNSAGEVFVTGHSNAGTAADVNFDMVTYRIDNDGTSSLLTPFALSDSSDVPNLMYWKNSTLYLAGSTWSNIGQRNKIVVKYNFTDAVAENSTAASFVSVYPNPSSEDFILKSDGQLLGQVIVTDMSGKIVFEKKQIQSSSLHIDSSTFVSGVYLCKISGEKNIQNQIIIKLD
jgi:uncharacterized delta-60 repeat protein